MRRITLALLILVSTTLRGQLKEEVIAPIIDAATAARVSNDFAAAETGYRQAFDAAVTAGDTTWQFRATFYLGLTKQAKASTESGDAAKALRDEAIAIYRQALALKSDSTATLINLAEAQIGNGDVTDAIASLEQGAALKDARYAEFEERLGDVAGDPTKAVGHYRQAALAALDNTSIHDKVIAAFLDPRQEKAPELGAYLEEVIALNQLDRALDGALKALETPSFPEPAQRGALAALALALSKKNWEEPTFNVSPAGRRLEALRATPPNAAAIEGIFALYSEQLEDLSRFTPWLDASGSAVKPAMSEGLRALARSMGATSMFGKNYARAVKYYQLARSFGGENDPALAMDLVNAYAALNDIKSVNETVSEYTKTLHPSQAAASDELDEYYEFYRSVAKVHASLPARDPLRLQSAEELQNAKEAFERATADFSIRVEPEVYEQLAISHELKGDAHQARGERLTAAEEYIREGDLTKARAVIAPVVTGDFASAERDRFSSILDSVVWLPVDKTAPMDAELVHLVKRSLIVLNDETSTRADRSKVLLDLRQAGVTVDPFQSQVRFTTKSGPLRLPYALGERAVPEIR